MKYKCLIDGAEFDSEGTLHNHISRRLKVKLETYYQQYYPRQDLLTFDPIVFKNKDFYFHSLFNSRNNMVKYLKKNKDRDTIVELIRLRKECKNLTFAPSTVEARTCTLPSPLFVEKLGHNYNQICKDLDLITRFDYSPSLFFDNLGKLEILVDSREQRPLSFEGHEVISSKLDFGDYTCRSHYNKVFIERKSLVDLCGTLSQGLERFQKEIARAKTLDSYIVVLIESPLESLATIGKTPETYKVKASPDFIAKRMRGLCQQFSNLQFLFVGHRAQMVPVIHQIFKLGENAKALDLQYRYDSGQLLPQARDLV